MLAGYAWPWISKKDQTLKDIEIQGVKRMWKEIKDNKELNCEELISRSLNCMRGHAIRAIGHLLWDNQALFVEFKDVIDKLTLDDDEAVRMACFYALLRCS